MPSSRARKAAREAIEGKPFVEDPIEDYTSPLDRPKEVKLTFAEREEIRIAKENENRESLKEAWHEVEDQVHVTTPRAPLIVDEAGQSGVKSKTVKPKKRVTLQIIESGGEEAEKKEDAESIMAKFACEGHPQQKLDLSNQKLHDGHISQVSALISQAPVHVLDLRDNMITDAGCVELSQALECDDSNVHTLLLCSNRIGERGAAALGNVLRYSGTVTDLDISGNVVGDEGVALLAHGALLNRHLATVALRHVGFDDEGCTALGLALRDNPALSELDISGNMFGPQGVRSIAKLLRHGKHCLREIDLRENRICDRGCRWFAQGLTPKCSLRTIGLSKCSIGDEGMIALAKAMELLDFLTTADVANNIFTDAGAHALARLIARNPTLAKIDLRGNQVGELGRAAFVSAVRSFEEHEDDAFRERVFVVHVAPGSLVKWGGPVEGISFGGGLHSARVVEGEAIQLPSHRVCDNRITRVCGAGSNQEKCCVS